MVWERSDDSVTHLHDSPLTEISNATVKIHNTCTVSFISDGKTLCNMHTVGQ